MTEQQLATSNNVYPCVGILLITTILALARTAILTTSTTLSLILQPHLLDTE